MDKSLTSMLIIFVSVPGKTWQTFGRAPVPTTIMLSFSGRNTWESQHSLDEYTI